MAFRQALALSSALVQEDLSGYQAAHREIAKRPEFMAKAILFMGKTAWLRSRVFRALDRKPRLFEQMLSLHVGDRPLVPFGSDGFMNLGWSLLP